MVLDGIAFTPPVGLEDRSNYVHRAEAPREELAVELELPVGAATPAAELLADQRESMAGFFDAAFGVEAEGDTTLAGSPAKFMRYFLVDEGERKYGKTIVGNPGGGDYVRIDWKGEVDGAAVDACVDPILRSFRAASDEAPAPPPGMRTRYAGGWAYDLPERFTDPRTLIWSDGDMLRVQLHVPVIGSGPLELESLLRSQLEPGRMEVARDDRELQDGALAHLQQRDELGREWSAYVALLRFDADSRELSIVATAAWSEDATLGRIVETLLTSVTLAQREVSP